MPDKAYRIFLASSYELKEDREQFEIFIGRQNNLLKDKNVYLQTVLWEDIGAEVYPTHKQDHYNKELKTCDVFVMLYWSKVGKYTHVEFEMALAQFRYTEYHPKIFVYRKTALVPATQTDGDKQSLTTFNGRLSEIGYFDVPYDDQVELTKRFGDELDKLFNSGYLKLGSKRYDKPAECLYTDGNGVPISFIGREKELEDIKEKLQAGGSLLLINSEGGVGKTSLAAKYWEESLYDYKYNAWLFCENGILQALKKLTSKLNLDLSGMNEHQQVATLKHSLLAISQDFLLVLDNANNPEDIEFFKVEFRGLRWRVLITSRGSGILEKEQEIHVNHLPPAQAKSLFVSNYNEDTVEFDNLLDRLLEALDYHTLLVEIFSKNMQYMREFEETLADFLKRLETKGLFLEERSFKVITDYTDNVHKKAKNTDAIIEILYDFTKLTEIERYHLVNIALLPSEHYKLVFLVNLFTPQDKYDYDSVLRNLAKKGWLSNEKGGYRMSPVLQQIILAKHEDTIQQASKNLIDNLNIKLASDGSYPVNSNDPQIASFAQLVPTIIRRLEKRPFSALSLLNSNLHLYYSATGDLLEAKKAAKSYETISLLLDNKWDLAVSYSRLGETHLALGDLDKAMDFFLEYNKLTIQFHESHPNNSTFKNGLALSYQFLGICYSSLGDLEKALHFFEYYNDLERQLLSSYPDNLEFKSLLAISFQFLGNALTSLGRLEKALYCFVRYNELEKQLNAEYPDNVNFKNNLAISFQGLGNTYTALGDLEKALQFYWKFNELQEQLFEKHLINVGFKNGLAISNQKLGHTYMMRGDFEKASHFFLKHNELEEQLFENYPDNVDFKKNLSISYQYLGNTYIALGDWEKALRSTEKFNELVKQLNIAHPDNLDFKNGLAVSYQFLGNTHGALGQLEKALYFFEIHNKLQKQLLVDYPENIGFKNGLAFSCYKLGDIYNQKNEVEMAKNYFYQAEGLWEQLVITAPQMVKFTQNLNKVKQKLSEM